MSSNAIHILFLLLHSTYAISSDCPNVIEFARGLKVNTEQPAIWTQLQVDCCTATGLTCDGNQRVTQIDWNAKGLKGIMNGTAIPSSLTHLYLYNNVISGAIPVQLPSGILYLYLQDNQMSGDFPSFPSTLQYLYLSNNRFTGSLRLSRPFHMLINSNWITDVVIQDFSALSYCDLGNNPLLGNSNIAALTMCTKIGLYSAGLLPVTRSSLSTLLETTTTVLQTTVTYSAGLLPLTRSTILESTEGMQTTAMSKTTVLDSFTTTFEATESPNETEINTTTMVVLVSTATSKTAGQQKTSIKISTKLTLFSTLEEWRSIVGTTQFAPMMREFTLNVFIGVRLIMNTILLTLVTSKTPFQREIKRMIKKGKKETS